MFIETGWSRRCTDSPLTIRATTGYSRHADSSGGCICGGARHCVGISSSGLVWYFTANLPHI